MYILESIELIHVIVALIIMTAVISEILPFFKKIKANSMAQLFLNLLKAGFRLCAPKKHRTIKEYGDESRRVKKNG